MVVDKVNGRDLWVGISGHPGHLGYIALGWRWRDVI